MSSPSTPDRLIPSAEELTEVVQAVTRVVATFEQENSRTVLREDQPDFEFWDQVFSGATTLERLHNALHQSSLCHSLSDTSGWPISVATSLVWLRVFLDEMPGRGTIDLQTKEGMIAAAARIEEAVEHVRARNKARRDANTIGDSADGSSDCGGKVVSAADKAHSALTNLYEATMSLGDALFDYKNDGLASVSPVYAAIEQWYEAKDAASQQILRAAHRIDDSLAEGPQPTTVLLNELDQLGRECEILQTKAATPTYLWAPGPERMRALLMVYGIGFFKGLVDQVITMRRQWDKLTGLLDRPGQGHVRSAGSAAEENLPGAASHPAMTRQEANIKARELLKVDATFADKSQRDWASEIGCSVGLVFNLPMRRAVMEQRSKLRKPKVRKPNVVALTHKLEATIGKPDKALEHLLSEHQDDQEPSPLDHDDPCSKPQRVKARRQV